MYENDDQRIGVDMGRVQKNELLAATKLVSYAIWTNQETTARQNIESSLMMGLVEGTEDKEGREYHEYGTF